MDAAVRTPPETALPDVYAGGFTDLLDALEAGEPVVFAAIRGSKQRVTVRLPEPLCDRLERLNLKIADFACAAIVRNVSRC